MNIDDYLRLFAQLRMDKNTKRWTAATSYHAPHKPFLLLSILDLFAHGKVRTNLIEITPELGELFAGYWLKVIPLGHRGNMALPFFHLRSSSFWHLLPKPGQEKELSKIRQVDTLTQLDRLVLGVSLDNDLYNLMQTEEARNALRGTLIKSYFSTDLTDLLLAQGVVNFESFKYSQHLLKNAREQVREVSPESELKPSVRDKGFRQAIMQLYQHRCALCGVRMMTPDGRSAVDAAHIVPWSISHNDDPHNGIALCRLCHWTFDEGLVSVSAKYTIMLSSELRTTQNVAGHLLTLENRPIIGPEDKDFMPELEAIQWHHHNVYRSL